MIDVTSRTNLVVAAGATINSGTGTNSLGADLTAAGAGDNGTGTLTVNAGANVFGANITLRGADVDVNATGTIGSVNATTTASTFVTNNQLANTIALAVDSSGNIYSAGINAGNDLVSKITPAGVVSTFISNAALSSFMQGLAFDAAGNLYISSYGTGAIYKVTPGGVLSTFVTVPGSPNRGMAFDISGNLYVANDVGMIQKVTPGGAVSTFATKASGIFNYIAFDGAGNLFASGSDDTISKITSGGVVTTFVASGLTTAKGLAFDGSGNLYCAEAFRISKITPAGAVSSFTATTSSNVGVAFDSSGNLYTINQGNTITKVAPGNPVSNTVTIRSSVASRPMSVGGTNSAVAGVNLTDAELARIFTIAAGSITFGDTAQTGDVTVTTATPATTAGAAINVLQATAGAGKIILDDATGTGTALNGGSSLISLTAGTGGVTATNANNTAAEISTTAASVTINTSGPVGTATNRIQFADNTNTAQQVVNVGTTTPPSSVFLDGLGSLTLGSVATANGVIDVTSRTNMAVNGTVNSGTAALSLGADLTAAGAGDNGTGTLTVNAGVSVLGTNIALRGADIDIASTATVGGVSSATSGSTYATGFNDPWGMAFDASGNLYVANNGGSSIIKVAPGGATSTFASGITSPAGITVDSSGNVYVCSISGGVVKKYNSSGTLLNGSLATTSTNDARGVVVDGSGNVYVTDGLAGRVSKFDSTGTAINLNFITGMGVAQGIAMDSGGNFYVADGVGNRVGKFGPTGAAINASFMTGLSNPFGVALDASGNVYVSASNTIVKAPPGGGTGTVLIGSLPATSNGVVVDGSGNVYYSQRSTTNTVNKLTIGTVAANSVAIRSSVASLPMSLGGANNAVTGVNLTDVELARIVTSASGSITFGDTTQTGDITFTTATPATTAGAAINVLQSTSGAGKIVLDDAAGTATALNGGTSLISMTAGMGGVTATSANNTTAEISTTAASVTINTSGPVGTATNRIQFADNTNTAQQVVNVAGASTVFVDGLGSLTLGSVATANGAIDVTSRTNLAVNGLVNSGTAALNLGADLTAASAGDNGTGTLTINAGSNVFGATINLRGADTDIASTASVGSSTAQSPLVRTFVSSGLSSPFGLARDAAGNFYVANFGANSVSKITPSGTVTTFISSVANAAGLAFDSAGNLYVAQANPTNKVSKYSSAGVLITSNIVTSGAYSGYDAQSIAIDSADNVYIPEWGGGPGSTVDKVTTSGVASVFANVPAPYSVAVDASNNVYVGNAAAGASGVVRKFSAAGALLATYSGFGSDLVSGVTVGAGGTLFAATDNGNVYTVTQPAGVVTLYASGLNTPRGLVFDPAGSNLYVANAGNNTIRQILPVSVAATTLVTIQSSVASRAMSIGGTNSAVAGVNLTDAELAQIVTSAAGSITFGDTTQIGDITFASATTATTAGAATNVIQSTSGAGKINVNGGGNALNGNTGLVTLTPGTGGIVAGQVATDVPISSNGFTATGKTLSLTLGAAPTPGSFFTIINNTSGSPITGTFTNLAQGGLISGTFNATSYQFVSNYSGGDGNDLVLQAGQPPTVTTLAATSITGVGATLNATVNANFVSSTFTFDYGTTVAYGTSVSATPSTLSTGTSAPASATLTGLTPNTTYHYRIKGVNSVGTTNGSDLTFRSLNNNPNLSNLAISSGTLTPTFASGTISYTANVTNATTSITVTPTLTDTNASVKVNGTTVASGTASGAITLNVGLNTINTVVTAEDGIATKQYQIVINRAATTTTAASNASVTYKTTAQNVTLNSAVTSSNGTVNEGTVTFQIKNGASNVGTAVTSATVSGGTASVTYALPAALAAQNYTIVATFNPTVNFETSSDNTRTLTVNPAATTTTTVAASAVYDDNDQNVTLNASVTSAGGPINEGTVTFQLMSGASNVGTAVVSATVASGAASVSYVLPGGTATGTYTIVATYGSSSNFVGSSDNTKLLTVTKAPTIVGAAVGNPTTYDQAAQNIGINATINSVPGTTVSGGTVTLQLKFGLTPIGGPLTGISVNSGTVNYALPPGAPAGLYTIETTYSGSANFQGCFSNSQTLTINTAPVAIIPADPTTNYRVGTQNVTLNVAVNSPAGIVNEGTITFQIKDGAANVGTAVTSSTINNGTASVSYALPAGLAVKTYTIVATLGNTTNYFNGSNNTHTLTVSPEATSLDAVTSFTVFNVSNQTATIIANITSAAGTLSVGTVTFQVKNGASNIGTAVTSPTIVNGVATVTYTIPGNTPVGVYSINATYSGSGNVTGSSDTTEIFTVFVIASTTTGANASVTYTQSAQNVTLNATVASPNNTVNEGTVTFQIMDGASPVGTPVTSTTVLNNVASVSYSLPAGLPAKMYTIVASYGNSLNIAPSMDSTKKLTVILTTSTTVATNSTTVYGSADQNVTLTATVTSPAGIINEGTVSFDVLDGGLPVGTTAFSATLVNGVATATYVLPGGTPLGTYQIDASYDGGANYNINSDRSKSLSVTIAPTTTTVATANVPINQLANQNVTLSATVTSPNGPVNEGTVSFQVFNGATPFGPAQVSGTLVNGVGTVVFVVPAGTGLGAYQIVANYSGNVNYTPSSDNTNVLNVNLIHPTITSPFTAAGVVGLPFTYTITATNLPTGFNASGLPPGLTYDTLTNSIVGIPTTVGVTNSTIESSNVSGVESKTLVITIAPNQLPVIPPLTSDENPGLKNQTVTYKITATDADTDMLTYTFNFGDGEPDITGTFQQGTFTTVSHVYTHYTFPSVPITMTVTDGFSTVTQTTLQTIPEPASGAADIVNVLLEAPPIVAPLDGLEVKVMASDGGVIQLGINVDSLTRAAYDVSTDWGDVAGRSSKTTGTRPVHDFNNRGLFVAKTTAVNSDTKVVAGKSRITMPLSSKETSDYPTHVRDGKEVQAEAPGVRTKPTNDASITLKSMKGKFAFGSASATDTVTFAGNINLPPNVTIGQPYEFWIAIGNIVAKTTIDKNGKGAVPGTVEGSGTPGVLKSLKISTKVKKGTTTVGGEPATVTVTYSSKGMVDNGFDTEGVSDRATDVGGGKSAPRKIQVAMLLDGSPFQTLAPVDFSKSSSGGIGTISGRSSKK
ncbi:MAG: Ig-like domain repeat protein [Planctomycetota bacterium]